MSNNNNNKMEVEDQPSTGAYVAPHLESSDYYWNSYAHFGIHEEMLKDEVRMRCYKNSILLNRHLFEGKTVLDVGCGTGIMSLFAVQAGAAKVIGVDASNIAFQAQQVVKDNHMEDKITIIKGKIEEVEIPVDKVDIIISEWMGYCLLYEAMLPSVLVARDRWLKPDGIILPDKAYLYITAIEDNEYKNDKINFWERVQGFDMTAIKKQALQEPLVDCANPNQVVCSSHQVLAIDIQTCKAEDLNFKSPFTIKATRDDYAHAFLTFFDIQFTKVHKPISFSTGPHAQYTHWKQTVFYLQDILTMKKGEEISGTLEIRANKKNPRDLDITIDYEFNGQHSQAKKSQNYFLC